MTFHSFNVVLVRPQIAENVGFVARTMKTFGFEHLTLVEPSFEWNLRSAAYKTASGAADVLEKATVHESLVQAVGQCHIVAGFSRRGLAFERGRFDLPAWADTVRDDTVPKRIALVFGSEDFGLSNDDKKLCHAIVDIPRANDALSLNLSHAAAVVLYELTRRYPGMSQPRQPHGVSADQDELLRVFDLALAIVDAIDFFKPGRREFQVEEIRTLLYNLRLTKPQYHLVMGLLNAVRSRMRVRGASYQE